MTFLRIPVVVSAISIVWITKAIAVGQSVAIVTSLVVAEIRYVIATH
jgi:hypothetical protein